MNSDSSPTNRFREVVPQYLAAARGQIAAARKTPAAPASALRCAPPAARSLSHTAPFHTSIRGRFDAIGEPSTAVCGTPIRQVPCFDSDVNGCGSPPMNRTDCQPSACKPGRAAARRRPQGDCRREGVRRQAGSTPRLAPGRPTRPAQMVSSSSDAGPPEVPGVEVVARCGWCDARRVEDLQVLWQDVAE